MNDKFIWTADKKGIHFLGDPKYAAMSIEQRGKDFYTKYYGCDIHCSSSLDKAKRFAETYVSTPRNKELAKRYIEEAPERERRHAEVMAILRGGQS